MHASFDCGCSDVWPRGRFSTELHTYDFVTLYLFEINLKPSMEISLFDSVLPWFREVGVSKRRTQAATLVLRLMGRCAGLKRPCTGPCLEGRAKKDISILGSLGSVTNSHRTSTNGKERHFFKGAKCYMILCLFVRLDVLYFRFLQRLTKYTLTRIDALKRKV